MKSLLIQLFIHNWPRKLISFVLSIILWLVVSHSMATTKTFSNIGVRINNIPEGKTIEGLLPSGLLQKRMTLTLTGNKTLLDDLNSNDLEVVLDASNQTHEWVTTISKKNLVSLSPELNLSTQISKITHKNFVLKVCNLVTERVPVIVTLPIGQAPKGYEFLDVWPYHLQLLISGPEDIVKEVKNRGIKLTFNLNDISEAQLDDIQSSIKESDSDVVSFYVPKHWKHVSIPLLSSHAITLDDPDAKHLRIDFVRSELTPLSHSIPINLYFPPNITSTTFPQKISLAPNEFIENKNGLKLIPQPLYVKGVSDLFLQVVGNMIDYVIIVDPKSEVQKLQGSLQFIHTKVLEDRFVSMLMSDALDDSMTGMQPKAREDYLRNRFRSYMNRFKLYKASGEPLDFSIQLVGNKIVFLSGEKHER